MYPIWQHVPNDDTLNIIPGNYVFGSDDDLKELILELHEKVHDLDGDYFVVIGNGATQVLQSVMWALGQLDVDGPLRVSAPRPYYSRFPSMVKLAGAEWNQSNSNVEIVTSPNNPDGEHQIPTKGKLPIYDYSYNWPQYTDTNCYVESLDKDIMVFSLAKATGHADMRIGWALIKKTFKKAEKIKTLMETHIEYTTMGTSKQAQEAAFVVLSTVSDHYDSSLVGKKSMPPRKIFHLKC
jgi:L-tryptophan--pyruvate aminotransferase